MGLRVRAKVFFFHCLWTVSVVSPASLFFAGFLVSLTSTLAVKGKVTNKRIVCEDYISDIYLFVIWYATNDTTFLLLGTDLQMTNILKFLYVRDLKYTSLDVFLTVISIKRWFWDNWTEFSRVKLQKN